MSSYRSFLPHELLDTEELYKIKKEVEEAIEQFDNPSRNKWVTNTVEATSIEQGTILEDVPMYFFAKDNLELQVKKTNAIILSNSCDATRRENIILAPLISFQDSDQTDATKSEYKKNKKFSVLYFPDISVQDYYINFDYIYNFNLDHLNQLLQDGRVKKLYDLTNNGYYLLITKLTIFFARPESTDIQRKNEFNL